jgi:GNAT superfamily N-acetyltransferase
MSFTIKPVEQCDIESIANLYIEVYAIANPVEKWSTESARGFIEYFFTLSPDLFFIGKDNDVVIAGAWGAIKPWWNGNKLYDIELFIKPDYQGRGYSRLLFKRLFETAIAKYKAISAEAITFNDRIFPICYYERIGFDKSKQLTLIEGNVADILDKLELEYK